uniref:Uncharacterized protein n=1 Tax=Arundo donax TaxID=35708 RepID=A0A0A9HNQ3_ARUDO
MSMLAVEGLTSRMGGLAAIIGTVASPDKSAYKTGSEISSGRGLMVIIGSVSVAAVDDGGLEADGGGIGTG